MSSKKTLISAAVGSAFAATLGTAPIASAAENPFAMQSLDQGYMVADAGKMGYGKCGMGKCGGARKPMEGKCGMSMMDTNKDGKVSKEEFMKAHEAMFDQMDANKDGFIDKDEMGKMMEGKCGMSMMDTNKDGKVSKEEFTKHHDAMFDQMDANKDGSIDKDEMGKMMDGKCGMGKGGGMKTPEGKCGASK